MNVQKGEVWGHIINFVVESLGLHSVMFEANSKTVFGKVRNSILDYLELGTWV